MTIKTKSNYVVLFSSNKKCLQRNAKPTKNGNRLHNKNHQKLYWQGINEAWHYDIINCPHLIQYNLQHFIVSFSDSDVTDDQTQFVNLTKWIFFSDEIWQQRHNMSHSQTENVDNEQILLRKKWEEHCWALEKINILKEGCDAFKSINDESSSYQIIWQ